MTWPRSASSDYLLQLMPKRRATWSAWNYLTASDGPKANVNSVALSVQSPLLLPLHRLQLTSDLIIY